MTNVAVCSSGNENEFGGVVLADQANDTPSVFHYTDSAGLLGILSSKSLYATDYRYLNDVSEGSMIRELIVPIFVAEIEQIAPKLRQKGLFTEFYEFHGVSGYRLQAERFYNALVNALVETSPPFVLSFCQHTEKKHIEHGLLSQWRGYAGSPGFAIEFDETALCDLIAVEHATFGYAPMQSVFVRYRDHNAVLIRRCIVE
jgi:hypothetical protein